MRNVVIRPCVVIRPFCKWGPPMCGDLCLLSAWAGERGAMCFNASPAMVKTAGPHVLSAMRNH